MGRYLLFYCLLLFSGFPLYAQQTPAIKATVSKDRILIGEPLQLTIEVQLPAGPVAPALRTDSIPHFEFSGTSVVDSSQSGSGWKGKAVYTITSFDSGQWVIPAFSIGKGIASAPIPVTVVFSEFDPQQDYHDIKDILEVPEAKKKNYWYWYAAGGLLLLLLLFWLSRRKRKEIPAPVLLSAVSPYEEALRLLAALEKEQPGSMEWHTRLTGIFRLYLSRKKGLESLQKTTGDLLLQLRQKNILEKERLEPLARALRISDFVKFARYASTTAEDKDCWREVKETIQYIDKNESAGS